MKKQRYFLSSTVAAIIFIGASSGVVQAGPCNLPDFAPATFSDPTTISNPYFALNTCTTIVHQPVPNPGNVVNV